ncbi:MAG: tRNA (guanine-N(7)-)-methyltransferase [Thermosynechococcus sp.]|uniref:tRNA (guanosine(46)-N7)-methyltransferase TrmB n=1 Tax=Thermosynechococcus sp. TaxID=2814275 RepID=UPI00220D0303|nr:MAG: tRNA (guanine-N(7)-)-methyltransferase [Thermosynechococcus sp.]
MGDRAMAVRVRQHVNPLSQKFQQDIAVPDWSRIYEQPSQPLHLDIGCARGTFLLEMAALYPEQNFLGLEIRYPLVVAANERRDRHQLRNLHYLWGNANVHLRKILSGLPLHTVTIQFPDPWFKRRHHKRRLVTPELVATLAELLPAGGHVFLQSDVFEVAESMVQQFRAHGAFRSICPDWLPQSPWPIATEREKCVLNKGLAVYRWQFERCAV